MPPKKICSDKAPLKKREWSVTTCYKRGVKAGFVAGLNRGRRDQVPPVAPAPQAVPQQGVEFGNTLMSREALFTEQGVKKAKVVKAIPQAVLQMKVKAGVKKAQQSKAKKVAQEAVKASVARQARLVAQERENELMRTNDVNIEAPRVKPAGRRQKFRNFYGLDRAPEVVAPNPVAPPVNDRPSIKAIMDAALATRRSKSKIDVLISNAYFNVPELTRDQKKAMKTAGMINYLKENKGYRD